MSYRDVNEKIFSKLDELELKKVEKKINQSYPELIIRSFPDSEILREDKAIAHLEKITGLHQNIIAHSLNELISQKKLIPAFDTKQRLHLRKLKL
jgi:hypothetical protein